MSIPEFVLFKKLNDSLIKVSIMGIKRSSQVVKLL
jgi:hypothetical protein